MRILFLLVSVLAVTSVAEAQKQGEPYSLSFRPSLTQRELANAVEKCDAEILRPSCAELKAALMKTLRIPPIDSSVKGMRVMAVYADYLRGLEVRPCTVGSSVLASDFVPPEDTAKLMTEGRIVFSRAWKCERGERFLWDEGRPVISLTRVRIVDPTRLIVQAPAPAPKKPPVVAQAPKAPSGDSVSFRVKETPSGTQRVPVGIVGPPGRDGRDGKDGVDGLPGTDCAGLTPTNPPRTCPGERGQAGSSMMGSMIYTPQSHWKRNTFIGVALATIAVVVGKDYCDNHNGCRSKSVDVINIF